MSDSDQPRDTSTGQFGVKPHSAPEASLTADAPTAKRSTLPPRKGQWRHEPWPGVVEVEHLEMGASSTSKLQRVFLDGELVGQVKGVLVTPTRPYGRMRHVAVPLVPRLEWQIDGSGGGYRHRYKTRPEAIYALIEEHQAATATDTE